MPVAVGKPPRKRGPPAPLNLQPSEVVTAVILEKEPVVVQAEQPVTPVVPTASRTTTSKARGSRRNVKGLALNLQGSTTSQETSPESESVPEPLPPPPPPPRRPSAASLPGASASAILRRTDEGDTPSTDYIDGPVEIMPLIWLGCEDNARDWKGLVHRGIRSILNVAKEVASPFEPAQNHQQMRNVVSTPNFAQFPQHAGTYQPAHLPSGRPSMHYLKLSWSHGQTNLVRNGFPEAMAFIDEALSRNEGVLVHCQCGVSRSATMVIALVMRAAAEGDASNTPADIVALRGQGMQGAYQYVQLKSKSISPNMSLIYQLLDYERALRGGNSPEESSVGASEDEEWERQRRLLDLSDQEEVWNEAQNLDREMEERRARKLSLASTTSNTSFTGAIGNGAPWRSRYGSGTFVRARAPSVESNVTSRSSISVVSEDPVEEEEEEPTSNRSTEATDEDAHRFNVTAPALAPPAVKPVEPLSAIPKRLAALRMTVVPPSAPASKQSFNLPSVPPSAPAHKRAFRIPTLDVVPPSAPSTKQSFNLPQRRSLLVDSDRSPQKKEKRRPPPLQSFNHAGLIPSIQVVSTPSASARTPSFSSMSSSSSHAGSQSSHAGSQSSRRRSFKPVSFVPFPSRENLNGSANTPGLGLPMGATPSGTQTLFVFPPSPRSDAMTPSTLTLTSTPLYTPGFGSNMTPRAGVFRQRKDSRRSYIQLSAVTPTTATARVDARGFFGGV